MSAKTPRCNICRAPTVSQSSVCKRCFGAVPAYVRLKKQLQDTEHREDALIRAIRKALQFNGDPRGILRDALEGADAPKSSEMAKPTRDFIERVREATKPSNGYTHALIRVESGINFTYACHMPSCELCAISVLASEFLGKDVDPS